MGLLEGVWVCREGFAYVRIGRANNVFNTLVFLFPVPRDFQNMAHFGAAFQVLPGAAHISPVAFEAGLVVGDLE